MNKSSNKIDDGIDVGVKKTANMIDRVFDEVVRSRYLRLIFKFLASSAIGTLGGIISIFFTIEYLQLSDEVCLLIGLALGFALFLVSLKFLNRRVL